jgi:hypothetical protein
MIKYPIKSKNRPETYIMIDEADLPKIKLYKLHIAFRGDQVRVKHFDPNGQIPIERIIYEHRMSRAEQKARQFRLMYRDGNPFNCTRANIIPWDEEIAVELMRSNDNINNKWDKSINGSDWAKAMEDNVKMREDWV